MVGDGISAVDARLIAQREIGDAPVKVRQMQSAHVAQLRAWRPVYFQNCIIPGGTPATVGVPTWGGLAGASGTTGAMPMFRLFPADLEVPGRATEMRVVLSIATNATAPGTVTVTGRLSELSAIGGGPGVVSLTEGTVLGSAAVVDPPTAGSHDVGDAFVSPAPDVFVALWLATSAATAANSRMIANLTLEMRHV